MTLAPTSRSQPLRVALVEDDFDVLKSLTLLLRQRGMSVDTYSSGQELLTHWSHLNVDCLISDYKMPRVNGIDLMNKLKRLGFDQPALMITGFFSSTLKDRAVEAGYNDVVEKSSKPQIILDSIYRVVGDREARSTKDK